MRAPVWHDESALEKELARRHNNSAPTLVACGIQRSLESRSVVTDLVAFRAKIVHVETG